MGRIPDRWRDYTPFHKPLEVDGVRILSVKTPLCEVYHERPECFVDDDDFLAEHERFTPKMLVQDVRDKFGLSITSIIDLTFTDRYYQSGHVPRPVRHYKLKCPGQQTPSIEICRRFNSLLTRSVANGEGGCVAVHCTHGVNRTGFLICQYLMKHHSMSPDEAVSAFVESRGHPIEREAYVTALHENADELTKEEAPDQDAHERSQPCAPSHDGLHFTPHKVHRRSHVTGESRHRGYEPRHVADTRSRDQCSHVDDSWRTHSPRHTPSSRRQDHAYGSSHTQDRGYYDSSHRHYRDSYEYSDSHISQGHPIERSHHQSSQSRYQWRHDDDAYRRGPDPYHHRQGHEYTHAGRYAAEKNPRSYHSHHRYAQFSDPPRQEYFDRRRETAHRSGQRQHHW